MTDKKLFVQIRHVGFVFEVARRIPCNRIHPAMLTFLNTEDLICAEGL